MTLRINLLLMLVPVLGCASQIERVQTSQPTAEQTQEEQAEKRHCQSSPIALDSKCMVASPLRSSSGTYGLKALNQEIILRASDREVNAPEETHLEVVRQVAAVRPTPRRWIDVRAMI